MIPAAFALAHAAPDLVEQLSPLELLVALYELELWLRPEQIIPRRRFRSYGIIAGRGYGKTFGIAYEINRRVREGVIRHPALMAPTLSRVRDVQVKSLVETSPPWFPAEPYRDSVRWPNGVVAEAYTPEAAGRSRSGNFDLTWLTEIVDWQGSGRLEAYENITTATRLGRNPQILWDTTSKGKNEIIQKLLTEHRRDPHNNILQRGTIFDNPMLTPLYLRDECSKYVVGSRRYNEELLGRVYTESAGAFWRQLWLDDRRVETEPYKTDLTVLGLDPALSTSAEADETGLVEGCRARDGQIYITEDFSGRMATEQWGALIVERCALGVAGVVIERNHAGDMPRDLIKVHAERKKMRIEVLPPGKPIPQRTPGRIYLREVVSHDSKASRAAPVAALYSQKRVHHVGTHAHLELEQTTWEEGSRRSPNRLDAAVFVVAELAGLFDGDKAKVPLGDAKLAQDALRRMLVRPAVLSSASPGVIITGRGRLGI